MNIVKVKEERSLTQKAPPGEEEKDAREGVDVASSQFKFITIPKNGN